VVAVLLTQYQALLVFTY